jgi:enoyl-CoA hydratase/carnithine racemase
MNRAPTNDVLTEMRDRVLWVVIQREARRNALNKDVIAAIHQAFIWAMEDRSVRAIVLTGAGEKAFCAGADLEVGQDAFAAPDEPTTDFGRLARTARTLPIPLIARINGACVAGGMGLMALCDLVIIAEHARFGLPESRVGVFPMQVLVYLRRLLSVHDLNWLSLTGELISAHRAHQMGIGNEVVPLAELDERIEALIDSLSKSSPEAIRRGKAAMVAMEAMPFEAALAFAETQIAQISQSADAREGMAAFREGRPPRWGAADGATRD